MSCVYFYPLKIRQMLQDPSSVVTEGALILEFQNYLFMYIYRYIDSCKFLVWETNAVNKEIFEVYIIETFMKTEP